MVIPSRGSDSNQEAHDIVIQDAVLNEADDDLDDENDPEGDEELDDDEEFEDQVGGIGTGPPPE